MRKPLQFWENAQFGDTRFNEQLRSFGPMLRKPLAAVERVQSDTIPTSRRACAAFVAFSQRRAGSTLDVPPDAGSLPALSVVLLLPTHKLRLR